MARIKEKLWKFKVRWPKTVKRSLCLSQSRAKSTIRCIIPKIFWYPIFLKTMTDMKNLFNTLCVIYKTLLILHLYKNFRHFDFENSAPKHAKNVKFPKMKNLTFWAPWLTKILILVLLLKVFISFTPIVDQIPIS